MRGWSSWATVSSAWLPASGFISRFRIGIPASFREASRESSAHPEYKQAVLDAHASDTVHTRLFDIGWPDAAHRVIRTPLVDSWERAGSPASPNRAGEGDRQGEQGVGDVIHAKALRHQASRQTIAGILPAC